jgi:hypothetical protein
VRSDCFYRHGVDVIPETQDDRVGTSVRSRSVAASGAESQAAGSWAAFVPAM